MPDQPNKELRRLEDLYGSQTADELLKLGDEYDNLTDTARIALREEFYRRGLWSENFSDPSPNLASKPRNEEAIFGLLRNCGSLLFNFFIALFGTGTIQTLLSAFYQPRTLVAILFRGYLLSSVIGLVLGFLVYRRWKLEASKWLGFGGIVWFFLGAILDMTHGTIWSRMSGVACSEGVHAADCTKWFIFSLPAVRTVFYSAGAWLCWRFRIYGRSPVENAIWGRF